MEIETEPSSRELLLAAPSPGFTNPSRPFPCHCQLLFLGSLALPVFIHINPTHPEV